MFVSQDGWSALMCASFYGNFKVVTLLLNHQALVDIKNTVSLSYHKYNVVMLNIELFTVYL